MGPPEFTIQSGKFRHINFLFVKTNVLTMNIVQLADPLLKNGPLRKQRRHIGGWVTRWFELDWEESTGMACLLVFHKSDQSDPPSRISLEQ